MSKLPIDCDWYNKRPLQKYILTSPYVLDCIESLPDGWKQMAHAIHSDIFENYDTLAILVKRKYGVGQIRMVYIWAYILEIYEQVVFNLHPQLKNLIINHLG